MEDPLTPQCHEMSPEVFPASQPLISSQHGVTKPTTGRSFILRGFRLLLEGDWSTWQFERTGEPTGSHWRLLVLYDALCARCCSGLVGYVFLVDGLATLVGSAMVAWVLHFSFLAVSHALGIQTFIHYVTHLAERQYFNIFHQPRKMSFLGTFPYELSLISTSS